MGKWSEETREKFFFTRNERKSGSICVRNEEEGEERTTATATPLETTDGPRRFGVPGVGFPGLVGPGLGEPVPESEVRGGLLFFVQVRSGPRCPPFF